MTQPPAHFAPGPAPFAPAPPQPVLAEGAEYHLALTGPGARWWRPLVGVGVMLAALGAAFLGFGVVLALGLAVQHGDLDAVTSLEDIRMDDPFTFVAQNLMLAALVPIVLGVTWVATQVRPGIASSVLGRFRWGWAGWCLLLVLPVWGLYVAVASLLSDDGASESASRPEHWVLLLVLMLLTTPLQSAGEEYLFRGWVMQLCGSIFRHRWVSLGVAALLSAGLFALAHGSLDVWIFLDLMGMAVGMVVLTWRTGGLEAAVVLHAVNNLFAIGYAILLGDLNASFIDPSTTSDPVSTLVSVVAVAVITTLLLLLARWRGVERLTAPRAGTVTSA